jgi:putative transposase
MAQSLAQILLHIVFSTQSRYKFLADYEIRRQMHAYLTTVFRTYRSPSLEVGGPADHIHALCSLSKTLSVAELIEDVKKASSKWIKTKGGLYTKFHWQNGYGAFSVSPSQVAVVRRYIRNQENHHRRITFQEEFRRILRKHGVDYDERYLWD